jgi:O-antigen biosynthesis protein WbqP
MKRAFDLVVAVFGLMITWPLILVLAILIRRDSDGPAIFAQSRVGRRGRPFQCYKLRTMRRDTPHLPSHDVMASQITPMGSFLRKTKLDELPQLWNVARGEMSLVGPRPCLPSQTLLVAERLRRSVLDLRPGITGLAQINAIDMSDPVRLAEVDAQYLAAQSFWLDLEILFRTVFGRAGQGDRVRN